MTSRIAADAASALRSAIPSTIRSWAAMVRSRSLFFGRRAQPERGAQRRLDHGADRPHERIGRDRRDIEMQPQIRVGEFNAVGSETAHPGDAVAQDGDRIVLAPLGGKRGGARLHRKADVGEIAKEALVDSGFEVPAEHVDIEHVPGRAFPDPRSDAGLGVEQSLGRQRLDALTQHGARHVEHRRQLRIARQRRAFGVAADDDVDPDGARHFQLAGVAAARRNHDEIGAHGAWLELAAGYSR